MLLFEINFGDRYPPYRTAVSLSSMQGVLAESSFRKQAWRIEDFHGKFLLLLL